MTKSVEHFKENKFSVSGHQLLLECCPKLIKTDNFGQNIINKSQYKNKNEQYCADRLFISIVVETFCQFSVGNCSYFLPWTSWEILISQTKSLCKFKIINLTAHYHSFLFSLVFYWLRFVQNCRFRLTLDSIPTKNGDHQQKI